MHIPGRRCCRAGLVLAAALLGPLCSVQAQRADARSDTAGHAAVRGTQGVGPAVAGVRQRSRAPGGMVRVIGRDSTPLPPIGEVADLLSSRVPGMLVSRPNGVTGADARIHIRGITTLTLPDDPLVIVDGVRVTGAGPIASQRIDDLDPEEVERVEVLSGPASAALYGGDGADGVILITTRRGQAGRPVVRLHALYGALNDVADYPANYGRTGTDPVTGEPVARCTLDDENQGSCVPGALTSWNPLENASPFHTGTEQRHGLSVSGGGEAITYYVAGDYDREDGVYADNERRRTHLDANITGRLGHALAVALTSSYVDGLTRLPAAGGGSMRVVEDGLFGAAMDDPMTRGYRDTLSNLLHDMGPPRHSHEYTVGLTAAWQPLSWLRSSSTVGFGHLHGSSEQLTTAFQPAVPLLSDGPAGDSAFDRHAAASSTRALTAHSALTASYGRASALSASTTIGVRYHRLRRYNHTVIERRTFPPAPGGPVVEAESVAHAKGSETGVYAQQRLAWRNRLVLTGGVRRDYSHGVVMSSTGKAPALTDASVNLAWAVSSEPFFPKESWINALRLRMGYGRTGRHFLGVSFSPGMLWSISLPGPIRPVSNSLPLVTPIPEWTREIEAGVDATLLHGSVDAALTYYDKRSTHLAAFTPVATQIGYVNVFLQDRAAVHNRGYEMLLTGSLPHSGRLTGSITLAGATNTNTLEALRGSPFYLAGSPVALYQQRMAPGHPVAGYWGQPFTFADANDDGIISRDEVQFDSASSFLGTPIPTRELSIAPVVTLFGRVTLSALFDYRGGFKRYNANDAYRCGSSFRNCRGVFDPSAPLAEQAAVIASRMEFDAGGAFDAPFIDDAAFWKLREVAVTFSAPHRWAERLAASDVRLTLAGRNLATWTKYPGLDPEINSTASDPLLSMDFSMLAPVRYLTARLDVSW